MQLAKRGDRVSLNVLRRIYYFQDEGGINLSADGEVSAIIPQSASDKQLAQINHAIKNEQLILGDAQIKLDMPDRDSDIRLMLEQGRNKIDDWMKDLREDKTIKNAVKAEKLDKIISFEKMGKNRTSVIKLAETILGKLGGVSPVTEEEIEKLEIPVTSGTSDQMENK